MRTGKLSGHNKYGDKQQASPFSIWEIVPLIQARFDPQSLGFLAGRIHAEALSGTAAPVNANQR